MVESNGTGMAKTLPKPSSTLSSRSGILYVPKAHEWSKVGVHVWAHEFQTRRGGSKQPLSRGKPHVALWVFIRPERSVPLRAIRRSFSMDPPVRRAIPFLVQYQVTPWLSSKT